MKNKQTLILYFLALCFNIAFVLNLIFYITYKQQITLILLLCLTTPVTLIFNILMIHNIMN